MEPGTWNEGGQALEEFQRGHDEMGGAIAIRGFELKDHLAGRCAAQACVAQGRTCDVATELFEFLPLLGATPCLRMQTKPLGTDTTLGLRYFWVREAQRRVFPRQYFLPRPGAKGNAVGAGRRMQRGQGRIGSGVSQIRDLGVFFRERAFAGQHLQDPGDDPRK